MTRKEITTKILAAIGKSGNKEAEKWIARELKKESENLFMYMAFTIEDESKNAELVIDIMNYQEEERKTMRAKKAMRLTMRTYKIYSTFYPSDINDYEYSEMIDSIYCDIMENSGENTIRELDKIDTKETRALLMDIFRFE